MCLVDATVVMNPTASTGAATPVSMQDVATEAALRTEVAAPCVQMRVPTACRVLGLWLLSSLSSVF